MKVTFLLGRLIFGGFFIYNGVNHFRNRKMMAQYVASKRVPLPEAAVTVSGAALLIGGGSILLGVKPKLGAAAIAGFLIGVSPVIHNFWAIEDPHQRQSEMAQFGKNVAMLGATFALMGVKEPWPVSVPIGQPSAIDQVRGFIRDRFAA